MKYTKIDGKLYMKGCDIINLAPIFCNDIKGVKNDRKIIEYKEIDDEYWIYARKIKDTTDVKKDTWEESEGISTKVDKVFIRKSFLKVCKALNNELNGKKDVVLIDEKGIEKAPSLILLEDHEKFRDGEGNILDIETRGKRVEDGIYFKVEDVSDLFEIKNLHNTIINKKSTYEQDTDYIFFNCETPNKKTKLKKELFLTYTGLIYAFNITRNNKTKGFRKWASKTLFTVQMGTKEAKNKLRNKLGVDADMSQQVFKLATTKISCVYLFSLGCVSDLRESMNIPDSFDGNSIVCKYGLTNDIHRRTGEHKRTYGQIKEVDLRTLQYASIDPQKIQEAENDLKIRLSDYKLKYEKHTELVVIPDKTMKDIFDFYELINKRYIGDMKSSEHQLELTKKETENMKDKAELYQKLLEQSEKKAEQSEKNSAKLLESEKEKVELYKKISKQSEENSAKLLESEKEKVALYKKLFEQSGKGV